MRDLAPKDIEAIRPESLMISVVVPAYNCEDYLSDAIKSVLNQTYQNFEIIIVDDGSTDQTLGIARTLASRDERICVITQMNSGGPAGPRNSAIRKSRGEFVAFLDPDDYWYPSKLERQIDVFIRHPDIDFVFEEADVVDKYGGFIERFLERSAYLSAARYHLSEDINNVYVSRPSFYDFSSTKAMGAQPSGVMIRRRTLNDKDILFPTDLAAGEDIDLWFRIMLDSKIGYINMSLHAYRQHPNSIMADRRRATEGLAAAHARNYRRGHLRFSVEGRRRYRRRISRDYFNLGYLHWCLCNATLARKAYMESLFWQPNAAAVVALAKTLLPIFIVRLFRKKIGK